MCRPKRLRLTVRPLYLPNTPANQRLNARPLTNQTHSATMISLDQFKFRSFGLKRLPQPPKIQGTSNRSLRQSETAFRERRSAAKQPWPQSIKKPTREIFGWFNERAPISCVFVLYFRTAAALQFASLRVQHLRQLSNQLGTRPFVYDRIQNLDLCTIARSLKNMANREAPECLPLSLFQQKKSWKSFQRNSANG